MKTKALFFAFFVISVCNAQVTFEKYFDHYGMDVGRVVHQTPDNGYIIVGRTYKTVPRVDKDVLLVKTNSLGDTAWTKTFGGTNYDAGLDVILTNDKGYMITGYTWSYGAGEGDLYLIKTDSLGNEEWMNTIGGPYKDQGLSIQQTSDNGFIITGNTVISNTESPDLLLVKTNETGDTEWTRNYGGSGTERGNSVIVTHDNHYVICGYTTSYGYGDYDVLLIKTNPSGDTVWTKTYGGPEKDCGTSVKETGDNGFIITGYTKSFGAGDMDLFIIKTDENGDTLWTKTAGGPAYDISTSVDITADNDYIITGYGESFGNGSMDVYLMKVNNSGNILWTQTFGGEFTDYAGHVEQTADGGFIIGGTKFREDSSSISNSDVYLIKTDNSGIVVGFDDHIYSPGKYLIYPNPNNGTFKIRNQNKISLIDVYDTNGKLIYRDRTAYDVNNDPNIEMGNMNKGLYFVKVYSDKGFSVIKVIIE